MDDSPMELQCWAAKCVCVRLVHEWAEAVMPIIDVWKKGNGYNTCSAHDWFLWQLYEMEVPRFANMLVPNIIRYQIEDNMALILEQVIIWIQYHHSVNFFHDRFRDQPPSSLCEYVAKLVWNHHFKIDYGATAKNMLTNENLNPLERFRFASTYCIVEEIDKFRDVVDEAPEWDFIMDPFVVYWKKYFKNELHTISVPDDFSVDTIMFIKTSEEFDLWPPVEYFFEKLDSVSKSSKFERIVELYGKRYLKDLLAKLTDKEWNLACRGAIAKIIEKIVQWSTLDDVRCIWKQFKSKIDTKNFCAILETLVPLSMRNASDFEKWTPLLIEIWTSASSRFKKSAVDMELWRSIGEKCIFHVPNEDTPDFRARRQISESMKFIRIVLKSLDAKKRSMFFVKNFYWLIIWAPFAAVDKLMREFLERYHRDVVQLKEDIAGSSEMDRSLLILLGFGEFDEFDTVLSFYLFGVGSDDKMESYSMRYKLALMMPQSGLNALSICLYFADWRPLYEFVKKTISGARIAPDAYMISLIELGYYPGVYHLLEKLGKCEMKDLKECLSTVLSSTDYRLDHLKKKFKIAMFKVLFDFNWPKERIFNRTRVQDFLMWIYNGDEKSIEINFKKPHLISKGFLVQLKHCITEGSFQATESIEEFLDWCFATAAGRQQFKREMIYKYRELKMIEDLLTRRRYRRSMLFWFFDKDVGLIEKFTADCSCNPLYAAEDK